MDEQQKGEQKEPENLSSESSGKKPEQPVENADMKKDIEENRAITFLSYIGILFLVPLLAKRESKFAQFHAKQGLILMIGWVLGSFLYNGIGTGFFSACPHYHFIHHGLSQR